MVIEIKSRLFWCREAVWRDDPGSESEVPLSIMPTVDSVSRLAVSAMRAKIQEENCNAPGLMSLLKHHGLIESRSGRPIRIIGRWLPRWASLLDVQVDNYWKRLPDDCCRIYYNHPRSCPGFTILAYACSGRRTSLATLRAGLTILDEIAILAGNRAIVCQSTNSRLDNRKLKYFGYVQHVPHLKGKHYIKRLDR